MDLAAKGSLAKVWMGCAGVRPGGMRGGRMLRFAEADTASAICIRNSAFGFVLLTLP